MQQINFYINELRPKKDWFTSKYLSVILAGLLVLLTLLNYVQGRQVAALESELNDKQLVLKALEIEFNQAKAEPKENSRLQIQGNILLLQKKIEARERLVRLIQGQALDENFSFYNAMVAMAKNATPRVALEEFTFSRGGKYIELRGEGARSYDVPDYLNFLRKEPAFRSSKFGLISIGNIKASGNVDFSAGYDGEPSFSQRDK